MILRKIIKIVATSCQILRLKCTKFDLGLQRSPDSLAGFKGREVKGGRAREGGEGRKRMEGEGREMEGPPYKGRKVKE